MYNNTLGIFQTFKRSGVLILCTQFKGVDLTVHKIHFGRQIV